ncbi:MAG: YihY/virulence factor BrkB family protein, partial [Ferruginibacter sp.]
IPVKQILKQLQIAFRLLVKNDPMRLAGATAFFTTFALPPILIILIQLLSLVFNERTISRQLFEHLGDIIGRDSVMQLIRTLRAFRGLADTLPLTIGGFIFLLFVATTLFKVIQSSINQIWMIRRTGVNKFRMAYRNRIKSTLAIIFAGVLFIMTLFAESLKLFFGKYIHEVLPGTGFLFYGALSAIISILIISFWFMALFRYLPDGKPTWKVAFMGGLITSILFHFGKYILGWLLPGSNIGAVYGASASIVLLLLFVFYSSLIFYFGAAFTKVWSEHISQPIIPIHNALAYNYTDNDQIINPPV